MQLSSAVQMWAGCALWQLTTALVSALTYHYLSGQVKIGCHTCLGLINPAGNAHVCFAWQNNRFDGLAEGRLQAVYPLKDFGFQPTGIPKHFPQQSPFWKVLQGLLWKLNNMRKSNYSTGRTNLCHCYYSLTANYLFYGLAMGHNRVHRPGP